MVPVENVSCQYFGGVDLVQDLPLQIYSSEMFDDHGGQSFFKVF